MKWNKLTLIELTKEEQEEYGYETLWSGPIPELDEEVLVTVEGKESNITMIIKKK